MATQEQLIAALQVVVNLARCVALKRALTAADPALNFWRMLHGNLLDVAVLEWCKLFGSDDEEHQQVHWKNVFADEAEFRTSLFAHAGLDQEAWLAYWQHMKAYRDQHVAHLDFSRRDVTHYPISAVHCRPRSTTTAGSSTSCAYSAIGAFPTISESITRRSRRRPWRLQIAPRRVLAASPSASARVARRLRWRPLDRADSLGLPKDHATSAPRAA